jgi:hypothetical protein
MEENIPISPCLSENLFNDGLNFFNLCLSFILQQWEMGTSQ